MSDTAIGQIDLGDAIGRVPRSTTTRSPVLNGRAKARSPAMQCRQHTTRARVQLDLSQQVCRVSHVGHKHHMPDLPRRSARAKATASRTGPEGRTGPGRTNRVCGSTLSSPADGVEHMAFVMGDVTEGGPVLVRFTENAWPATSSSRCAATAEPRRSTTHSRTVLHDDAREPMSEKSVESDTCAHARSSASCCASWPSRRWKQSGPSAS